MKRRSTSRLCVIVSAVYPTAIIWAVFLFVGFWLDASWPSSEMWREIFVAVCFLIEFFLLKALLLARRMQDVDYLTVSLIGSNLSLAFVVSTLTAFGLWRVFFLVEHRHLTLWILRIAIIELIVVVLFACWQLVAVIPQEQKEPGYE